MDQIPLAEPPLSWQMTTVSSLIEELNRENNVDKQKQDSCRIEYKGEFWLLKKL